MRITRIEVEGARGRATVSRKEMLASDGALLGRSRVVIAVEGVADPAGAFQFHADCRDEKSRRYAAARLQKLLDGHAGTQGDVAGYLRVIETFAD